MDGYAVLARDVAGASAGTPVTLPVDGEIAAGDTSSRELTPGTCIRIMTGAAMPGGADAVVPVELTDGDTERSPCARPCPPAPRSGGAAATPCPATCCCPPGPGSGPCSSACSPPPGSAACRPGPAPG